MQITVDPVAEKREAFVERLLQSVSGAFDVFTLYLGDQLGYYEVLAADGALTSAELAARTGTQERYAREWLEQQTVTGILQVEEARLRTEARRYFLPPGHDEVLADRASLDYLAPLAQLFVGAVFPLQQVMEAFRTGVGVSFGAYGKDMREGQARVNRAAFLYQLGQEWLPAIADLHARLEAAPFARVADIGCGGGWSSIGMAQCYRDIRVDGFDLDAPSVDLARSHAAEAEVQDRVQFHAYDAAEAPHAGHYDLVTAFECVHDMSDPVGALRTMCGLINETGTVLIMDERVGDTFTATGNDVEHIMYGWSVLHCLPAGMADHPSAATGTVMRTDTLRQYAKAAGFRDLEVLPIDNYFFRFYRLHA